MTTKQLATVFAITLTATVLAGEELPRPALVYTREDRAALLKRLAPNADSFEPADADKKSSDAVRRTLAEFRFDWNLPKNLEGWSEEARSQKLLNLAILMWLDPKGSLPNKTTYAAAVSSAVKALTVPAERVRDFFPEKSGDPNKPGPWHTYLDASVSLWNDALAFDLLSSEEVRGALDAGVLDQFYAKLADGIGHQLVAHLRTYNWEPQQKPIGNNWNSREFAGVGMLLLSLRDRMSQEPQESPRHVDFVDGLKLLRSLYPLYLEGWGGTERGDGGYCFYYEGPHYLRYWVEYSLALGVAWQRAFPDDPLKLLAPDGPIARFCRAHTLNLAPTHRGKAGETEWTCIPVDDTWTYPDESYIPLMLGAAWIPFSPEDRSLVLNAAKRAGARTHVLLLSNPILDELNDGKTPAPLPLLAGIQHDGVGVARTSGDSEQGLTVFVKNFETPIDNGKPSLFSHSHADNGEVVAYRNAEPVLIVPGYGPEGYANKSKTQFFTHWEHDNTLCVEEPAGSGTYELPVWKDHGRHDRLPRTETCKDAQGEFQVLEMATPQHHRSVIVVNESCLLVIDRLEQPRKIKLCWWGNGSITGRPNASEKKGEPLEGDAAQIVTAKIDTAAAEGIFFRGPSLATRIHVVSPAPADIVTQTVEGEYGPRWYKTNYPLTGMHVTSKAPVKFAVTLVEIAPKGAGAPVFQLSAEASADSNGVLQSVFIRQGEKKTEYRIAADGKVTRSGN